MNVCKHCCFESDLHHNRAASVAHRLSFIFFASTWLSSKYASKLTGIDNSSDYPECRSLQTIGWGAKVESFALPPSAALLMDNVVRVKCSPDDTVGDLKKLIAAQTGTDWRKIQLKKWYDMDSVLVSATGRT
jgi:hypothetical protein